MSARDEAAGGDNAAVYEVRYWFEDQSGYAIWAEGLTRDDAEREARQMRLRRPRNPFTVEAVR